MTQNLEPEPNPTLIVVHAKYFLHIVVREKYFPLFNVYSSTKCNMFILEPVTNDQALNINVENHA